MRTVFFFVFLLFSSFGFSDVKELIEQKQYAVALKTVEARLAAGPPTEELLYFRALCLFHVEQYPASEAITRRLARKSPRQTAYRNLCAAARLRQKNFTGAIPHLIASVSRNPRDPDVWANLNYALRRSVYASNDANRFLVVAHTKYKDALGAKMLWAEFQFFKGAPTPMLDLLEQSLGPNLPTPYLQRFALFACQRGDIALHRRVLLIMGQDVSRIDACMAEMKRLPPPKRKMTTPARPTPARKIPDLPDEPIITDETAAVPDPERYRLPFSHGEARYCAQGADGAFSHEGRAEFACDFYLPSGSPVLAARSGRVRAVERDVHFQSSNDDYGACVVIEHSDGYCSRYYHLAGESIRVNVGQMIRQGQVIAAAGTTRLSQYPILHFDVVTRASLSLSQPSAYKRWKSVPFVFSELEDMKDEKGSPIAGRWYVSHNHP